MAGVVADTAADILRVVAAREAAWSFKAVAPGSVAALLGWAAAVQVVTVEEADMVGAAPIIEAFPV
jgi:hypothetical protein